MGCYMERKFGGSRAGVHGVIITFLFFSILVKYAKAYTLSMSGEILLLVGGLSRCSVVVDTIRYAKTPYILITQQHFILITAVES
jgi:hypothetical protein